MLYRVDIFDGGQLDNLVQRLAAREEEITVDELEAWRGALAAYFRLCMEYGPAWLKKEGMVDFTTSAWALYQVVDEMIELYVNDVIGYIWDIARIYDWHGPNLFKNYGRLVARYTGTQA